MQKLCLDDIKDEKDQQTFIEGLCGDDSLNVTISYISDFRSAKVLREFIDNVCKGYGVEAKWRTRLVLIIDELNNNAIEYGSKKGDTNLLSFSIKKEDKGLYLSSYVQDTGKGDHPKSSKDMEKLREVHKDKNFAKHHSIRGRGLFLIISHLVDTLYFQDAPEGGLIVGIEKNLEL